MNPETRFLALVAALLMFWTISAAVRESAGGASNAVPASTAVNAGSLEPSDIRLKEQVRDLSYGLPELLRLHPVSYRLKSFPSRPKIGLIAQEVEPLIPEVVYLSPDDPETMAPRYYSINYAELVPLLVKSIQDQEQTIRSMQERLEQLETPITQ